MHLAIKAFPQVGLEVQAMLAHDQFVSNAFIGEVQVQLCLGKPHHLDEAFKQATEIELVKKRGAVGTQDIEAQVHVHGKEEKSVVHIPNPKLLALQMLMEIVKELQGEVDQLRKCMEAQPPVVLQGWVNV